MLVNPRLSNHRADECGAVRLRKVEVKVKETTKITPSVKFIPIKRFYRMCKFGAVYPKYKYDMTGSEKMLGDFE